MLHSISFRILHKNRGCTIEQDHFRNAIIWTRIHRDKRTHGTGQGSWEQGVWDYKALPRPGAVESFDREAGASWCYDKKAKVLVSYDSVGMAEVKAKFVLGNRLGGGMWWESSGDKGGKFARKVDGSLIGTFVDGVGGIRALDQSSNALVFPESKYDNLRAGLN